MSIIFSDLEVWSPYLPAEDSNLKDDDPDTLGQGDPGSNGSRLFMQTLECL